MKPRLVALGERGLSVSPSRGLVMTGSSGRPEALQPPVCQGSQWREEPSVPGPDAHPAPCRSFLFTFCFVNYMSDSPRAPQLIGSISVTSLPPTDPEMEIAFYNLWLPSASPEILEISIPIRIGSLDFIICQLNN